jgi:hypothetical protein
MSTTVHVIFRRQGCADWDSQVSKLKIDDLLSERHRRFTPLQRLLRQAANQESWTAGLRALLPESLQHDCRITDIRAGHITIVCSNAASATRVRFLAPELLSKLQELAEFRAATRVQVRVSDK